MRKLLTKLTSGWLRYLLTLLLAVFTVSGVWATDETVSVTTSNPYAWSYITSNKVAVSQSTGCSFQSGYCKVPKGNTVTITGSSGNTITITKIVYTTNSSKDGSGTGMTVNTGSLDTSEKTWTGSANSITLTNGTSSSGSDLRIATLVVTYTSGGGGGGEEETPSFTTNPAATTNVTAGSISGSLTVAANNAQSYAWYQGSAVDKFDGTTSLGTGTSFTIPTSLTKGTYYYYCVATNTTKTANSTMATVNVAASSEKKVSDLVAISDDWTFIADNVTSNGTVSPTANTLYCDDHIFFPTANTKASNKGKNTFGGAEHLNSLRIKNAQDRMAFKVSGACTAIFYTESKTDRGLYVSKTDNVTSDNDAFAKQTASTSTWSVSLDAAGIYYLTSYGNDFYIAGIEFKFPHNITCEDAEHGSVTASPTSAIAGKEITLTPNPATGYELNTLTAKDASNNNIAISDNKFTMPTSAVTVTATFKAITVKYTITYAANGGSGEMTDANSPYEANAEVTLLENTFTAPTGQAFSSWLVKDALDNTVDVTDNKFTMPASNVTVTAQWENAVYNVKLYPVSGTIATGKDVTQYKYGTGANLPVAADITRTGYTFDGWYTTNAYSGNPVSAISAEDYGDKEFYAKWSPKTSTVTLSATEATTAGTASVTATYDAAMPTDGVTMPQRTGYIFNGFYDAETGGTQYYTAAGASAKNWDKEDATTTLYAQWTEIAYATSVDFAGYISDNSITTETTLNNATAHNKALFTDHNITISQTASGVSLDPGKENEGYVYKGLKLKTVLGTNLTFYAKAGQNVTFKMGYVTSSNVTVSTDVDVTYDSKTTKSETLTGITSTTADPNYVDYTFTTSAITKFTIATTSGSTAVIKSITIKSDYPKWYLTSNIGKSGEVATDWSDDEMTDGTTVTKTLKKGTQYQFKLKEETAASSYTWFGAQDATNEYKTSNEDWTLASPGNDIYLTAGANGEYIFTRSEVSGVQHVKVTYPTAYTVTYESGNDAATGSTASNTNIAAGEDQVISANGFTYSNHTFAGWKADVAVTINDVTVPAGDIIAAGSTLQNINSNIALTAQWTYAGTTAYYLNFYSSTGTKIDDMSYNFTKASEGATASTVTLDLKGKENNSGYSYGYYFRIGKANENDFCLDNSVINASITDWTYYQYGQNYVNTNLNTLNAGTYTFTLKDGDASNQIKLSVAYPETAAVTFGASDNGAVSAVAGEWTLASGDAVAKGQDVVFTATPSDGYSVEGWYSDAEMTTKIDGAGTETAYTISSIAAASTVYVKFAAPCATPTISCEENLVTITTTTDGASIYYTTDGTEPTTSSTAYSAPFVITATCTVKAIAVKSGMLNSEVKEQEVTYVELIVAKPQIAVSPFDYNQNAYPLVVSCATTGASLSYKIDNGSAVSVATGSTVYVEGDKKITLSASKTNWKNAPDSVLTLNAAPSLTSPEVLIPTVQKDQYVKDVDQALRSISIEGKYFGGDNGGNGGKDLLKLRTNYNSTGVVTINVNNGCTVTKVEIKAYSNNKGSDSHSGIIKCTGYSVDGGAATTYDNAIEFPQIASSANDQTYKTASTGDITATSSITFNFDNSNVGTETGAKNPQIVAEIKVYYDPIYEASSLSLAAYDASNTYWATYSNADYVTFWPAANATVKEATVSGSTLSLPVLDKETVTIDGSDVEGYFVPADEGVLIKSLSDPATSVAYYTVIGKTLDNFSGNMLHPGKGVTAAAPGEGTYKYYMLAYKADAANDNDKHQSLGFYWGATDGAAFKSRNGAAYLAVPQAQAAALRGFSFYDAVEPAVEPTTPDQPEVTALDEAKAQSANGIFLLNGKVYIRHNGKLYTPAGQLLK